MPVTLLPLLTLLAAAHAEVTVLVSSFEGIDADSRDIAARLPALLEEDLAGYTEFRVLMLRNAPPVASYGAVAYMLSCPPGESVGCTFVVGQAARVKYAVTGRVRVVQEAPVEKKKKKSSDPDEEFKFTDDEDDTPLGEGLGDAPAVPVRRAEVDVSILDVTESRETVSFVVPYASDAEDTFASGISFVLLGVAQGDVGAVEDLRSQNKPIEKTVDLDRAAAIKDLDELNQELGDVAPRTEEPKGPRREPRPRMTYTEMLANAGTPKPWDQMALTPREYLSWWNCGWDLGTWRALVAGREGQVLVRPTVGIGAGPVTQYYHGRFARDPQILENVREVYAFQDTTSGVDGTVGLSLGYGFTPIIEAEVGASVELGSFSVDISDEIYGGDKVVDSRVYLNTVIQAQAGVRVAPLQVNRIHPVAGLGFVYWRGTTVAAHHAMSKYDDLPVFDAPSMFGGRVHVGGEARLKDNLDFFVQVPVTFVVGGTTMAIQEDPDGAFLPNKLRPMELLPVGASLQLGLQARFGGEATRLRAAAANQYKKEAEIEGDEP